MNWKEVEEAIWALRPSLNPTEQKTVAVLCAAYKVGADTNRISALTGYPVELVHDALGELRDKMFITGKSVTGQSMMRALPNSQALLKGLLLNEIPVIEPTPVIQPTIQEQPTMEAEMCKCGRPAKHRGHCKGAGKPKAAKAIKSDTAPAKPTPKTEITFSIFCETNGQRYEASGTTRQAFDAALGIAGQMLEA